MNESKTLSSNKQNVNNNKNVVTKQLKDKPLSECKKVTIDVTFKHNGVLIYLPIRINEFILPYSYEHSTKEQIKEAKQEFQQDYIEIQEPKLKLIDMLYNLKSKRKALKTVIQSTDTAKKVSLIANLKEINLLIFDSERQLKALIQRQSLILEFLARTQYALNTWDQRQD